MNEADIAKWVTKTVEPLEDSATNSKLFRCAATLKDGVLLPCVIIRSKQAWVKLAMKRFADCQNAARWSFFKRKKAEFNLLTDYPSIVQTFVIGKNSVVYYEIKELHLSRHAIPLARMREINGETSMGWTQFTAKMKDGTEFEFGTTFYTEFFDMPQGYSAADIVKIIPAPRLRPDSSRRTDVLREKPHFTCFIDGV